MLADKFEPPYYAVIFTSLRTDGDNDYSTTAERMVELASSQKGFLGYDSVRNGLGITVSYWTDLESIAEWKRNSEHLEAQKNGRTQWYESYRVRIAKVEREYGFDKPEPND